MARHASSQGSTGNQSPSVLGQTCLSSKDCFLSQDALVSAQNTAQEAESELNAQLEAVRAAATAAATEQQQLLDEVQLQLLSEQGTSAALRSDAEAAAAAAAAGMNVTLARLQQMVTDAGKDPLKNLSCCDQRK